MPATEKVDLIRERLFSEALESTWRECLQSFDDPDGAEREAILDWLAGLRKEAIRYLESAAEAEDLEFSLGVQFIELKSRWMKANTLIQYQLFRTGKVNDKVTYRASTLSFLIDALAQSMSEEDVERINEFLAEPICDE